MDACSTDVLGSGTPTRFNRGWWLLALALIWLLALALRGYYLTTAMVFQPIRGDAVQYHAYAWNLLHHGVFSMAAPGSAHVLGDSFRDPGYPVFLALGMRLFGDFDAWYPAVLLAQGMLGALTVVLLMIAARGWLSDRWLIGAGVLMAVWPHSITITSFLLTETLFGFLCALALCLLSRGLRRRSHGWLAGAGVVFGAAALTNAILLPFAPLLGLLLLARRKLTLRMTATFVIAALLLPLAWNLRNTQLPAGQSSSGRAMMNLVQGSWPDYHLAYIQAVMGKPQGQQTMQAIQHEVDVAVAAPAKGIGLVSRRMVSAPLHYLAWYLSKPALLWDWDIRMGQGDVYVYPTANSPFNDNPWMRALESLCHSLNPLLMVLALLGCLPPFIRPRRMRATQGADLAIAALAIFVTATYSVFQSEPRYSIPFRGIEILLAACAIQAIAKWLSDKRSDARHAAGSRAVEAPTTIDG